MEVNQHRELRDVHTYLEAELFEEREEVGAEGVPTVGFKRMKL
jgi:hypothetical protein